MPVSTSLRSVAIGAATGLRSQMGLAAVVLVSPGDALPARLRSRAARVVAGVLAGGELIGDKLAAAPDRTEPPGLILRMACGAGSAGLLARSEGASPTVPAALGAAAATGAAFAGLAARSALSERYRPVVVAVVEDLLALGVALTVAATTAAPGTAASHEAGTSPAP